jgi:hypothetical protein
MDKNRLVEIFEEANEAVVSLPEHLQSKAFELAVNLLTGGAARGATPGQLRRPPVVRPTTAGESPDVSDLLRVCKRNPDRYVVFLKDAEDRDEPATVEVLRQAFRTYKQDVPRLPNRDLDELVAKGLVEKDRTANPLTFLLKAKGRAHYDKLVAAIGEA